MGKGLSLHIGLNTIDVTKYTGKYQTLRNAENDTNFYHELAVKNNYNARKLIGTEATSDNVLDSLKSFATQLTSGDSLFISYSGHGTRVKDLNGDEGDKFDEALVLYDRLFIDDEFQLCWARFEEGVRIFFINDSCYNGSVTRFFEQHGEALKSIFSDHVLRGIDNSESIVDFEKNISFYKSIKLGIDNKPVKASIIHIGACQDNQLADDGVAQDKNGKFTIAVQKIYGNGTIQNSYKSFFNLVKNEMPPWQTPSWDNEAGKQDQEFENSTFLII